MTKTDNEAISENEIALMDATKTLIDILLASGVATPTAFDQMFSHQRDGYLGKQMGNAAGIMEMLRRFAVDPQREAYRVQTRQLLKAKPEGSA